MKKFVFIIASRLMNFSAVISLFIATAFLPIVTHSRPLPFLKRARCEGLFIPEKEVGFAAPWLKEKQLRLANHLKSKVSGYLLLQEMRNHYAFNLYFQNSQPQFGTTELIGKTGTFVAWELFETQSLYADQDPKFQAKILNLHSGKLISYSMTDSFLIVENSQGQRAKFFLPKAHLSAYNVRSNLLELAKDNRDWDGDITGLSATMGYAVTFIPK